ncbi:AlpA family phage regulatory protein [Escherichia coli]|nr:AlpA family phage regulatory protein [Escherichia coli]MCQ6641774.1 AlpA family phage regulatory protein [Escherichia coli]MCR6272814.1 AlpA family phage regulatory protein [Escherichia coli]MCV0512770.1 AlpA family phage regulatory protein [Escherichia coli]MCV5065638.1 AlpA family phage regulatory protein [Escherichia coli]MCV5068929.1 AlpA family phage regulatory protein [Escherichia coli]
MTVNLPLSLGITRRTIFRWMSKIKNWPIPVSLVGARVKFIRSEIMEFYKNKGARHQ